LSLLTKMLLVALLLAGTVALSRWVPRHPRWRPFVIALNLLVSIRYLWWRGTETLNWESGWGIAVSLTVYLAEIYGFLVVLHHYVIATRTTRPEAPPPDTEFAPSVDVFVATYNEGVEILYRTLAGCLAMGYPQKRIHVLDDGNRAQVAELCRRMGVFYLGREKNRGAKAGNLNNGLAQSDAELVVTLDADHVPVSSFLTETVGFFRDREVVQVQTAHHFYNPDLFQDRLRIRKYIANEQEMFYRVVQPGRDVYNSSFYCGSGAVFRRSALEAIGGFPETTVTEDLHTSMLLHARGWKSVYLNRNLSAGLAPESYDAYLTQRRRWARGTYQVIFGQGGLFLRGLSLMQRVNYFATFWYWLYGFPRMVYLIAPLLFLLAGLHPLIVRDLSDLLTFYLPHLAISIVAFQLVNRSMRRLFWSDVYESCISVQVALTALVYPFTASKVRFAVTPKGRASEQGADLGVAAPMMVLAVLGAAGLATGLIRLAIHGAAQDGTLINTVWAAYNLVVLGMGLLLLKSRPSRRGAVRLPRGLSCLLAWNGSRVEAETVDLSETGVSFRVTPPRPLPEYLDVTLTGSDGRLVTLRGRLVRSDRVDRGSLFAAVDFVARTEEQHRRLVELIFSPPDAWSGAAPITMGAPEHLARIVRSVVAVFSRERRLRRLSPRFRCRLAATIHHEDGAGLHARVVDISDRGAGVRLPRGAAVPSPEEFRITIAWNELERTTFTARIRDVRSGAGGERILGLVFRELAPDELADLRQHLYRETAPVHEPERVTS
jgi:cellulose synthase (UDP-forming)